MPEPHSPRRSVRHIASVVSAVLYVIASLLACLVVLIISTFRVGGGYEATTAADWVADVGVAARVVTQSAMWCALGLLGGVIVAAIAVRVRNVDWTVLGVVSGVMFASTMLGVALGGSARVDDLATRASEAVGNTAALPPPAPVPVPPPVFTTADARAGLQEMAMLSIEAAVAPVSDPGGLTGAELAAIPATSGACEDDGAELTLTLLLRTGDNGRSLELILQAWDSAGYAPDRAMQ